VVVSSLGAARAALAALRPLRRDRRPASVDPWRSPRRIAIGIVAVSVALVAAGLIASRSAVSVSGESAFWPGDPSEISSLTARWFKFDAKRLADGSVRGSYRYRGFRNNLPFDASGRITCLEVRGRRAWIGGRIEQTNDPLTRGEDMWFQVLDSGARGSAVTLMGMSARHGAARHYCTTAPEPRFRSPVGDGRIVVRGPN
jgi:hypothetical protein